VAVTRRHRDARPADTVRRRRWPPLPSRLDRRHEDTVGTGVEGTLNPRRGALWYPEYRIGGFAGRFGGPDDFFRGFDCYRHVFEVNDERIEAPPGQHVSYRGVSDSERGPSNVARPHSLRQ